MCVFAEACSSPTPSHHSPCMFHLWSFCLMLPRSSNHSPACHAHTHKTHTDHTPLSSLPGSPCHTLKFPFSNLLEEDQTGCKTESLIN